MILTVTLNPSVDIRYKLDTFPIDAVSRVGDVKKTAGGKGLNVSRVLRQLNANVAATGFLGGALGQFIREEVEKVGIVDRFVNCADDTRNCIAVIHDDGQQTELLEGGPAIDEAERLAFLAAFEEAIQQVEYVAISGSLPKGLAADFYNELLSIATKVGVPVLLDTSGTTLEKAVAHDEKPFFIKPNEDELAGLLGADLLDVDEKIMEALQDPLFNGIEWIVVTLGASGAIVRHQETFYRVSIPTVEAVNPVGSGDSVVAGFAYGFVEGFETVKLLKHGVVMGLLNAMEEATGSIDPSKIESYVEQIEVAKMG